MVILPGYVVWPRFRRGHTRLKEGNIAWLLPLHTCAQCHPWAVRVFLRQSRDTKRRSDGYDDVVVLTVRLKRDREAACCAGDDGATAHGE